MDTKTEDFDLYGKILIHDIEIYATGNTTNLKTKKNPNEKPNVIPIEHQSCGKSAKNIIISYKSFNVLMMTLLSFYLCIRFETINMKQSGKNSCSKVSIKIIEKK